MDLVGELASDWLRDGTQPNSQSDSGSPIVFIQFASIVDSVPFQHTQHPILSVSTGKIVAVVLLY